MTAIGATPPLARASAKDGCPCFADLHHHDLRPGEPPEGQLDGRRGCARPPSGAAIDREAFNDPFAAKGELKKGALPRLARIIHRAG
jgi:hypothetical protein